MKVAIYVRLSKEDEEVRRQALGKTESESIQNQKSLLLQYARDRGMRSTACIPTKTIPAQTGTARPSTS